VGIVPRLLTPSKFPCYMMNQVMATQIFVIKSLYIQNTIMLFVLGVVVFFLVYSLVKRKPKHLIASFVWIIIVVWFFNSPFFGFSAVSVSSEGIGLNYGILSLRNDLLPIDSPWKVETHSSGIRKMKKLYLIRIADRESMKVRRNVGLGLLEEIGSAIEDMKAQKLGDRRGLSRLRHPQADTIS